jgi:limonene-1,2-epoxide hydrolase
MPFDELLRRFAAAVQANDGAGLAALFTPDGVYEDGFFGPHQGHAAIAAMLARFHQGGRDYLWEFLDPVIQGDTGYARWRFSYASRLPESLGRPVLFEGMSCFSLEHGRIARYREVFDRGLALARSISAPSGSSAWPPAPPRHRTPGRKAGRIWTGSADLRFARLNRTAMWGQ